MDRRNLILGLLVVAAPPLPASALTDGGAAGLVQICRASEDENATAALPIEIPRGACFGDSGYGSDHRGTYWPLWIVTTDSAPAAGRSRVSARAG